MEDSEMPDDDEISQMSEAIALSLQDGEQAVADRAEDMERGSEGAEDRDVRIQIPGSPRSASITALGISGMLSRSQRLGALGGGGASRRDREADTGSEGGSTSWLFSAGSAMNVSELSADTHTSPGDIREDLIEISQDAVDRALLELEAGPFSGQHIRSVAQRIGSDDVDSIAGAAARRHRSTSPIGGGGSSLPTTARSSGSVGAGGAGGRSAYQGPSLTHPPRTEAEWEAAVAGLEALIAGRPVAAHALDEAQRGVNLLLDGKKALKGRRLLPLRKGDVVTGCGEGGESGAGGGDGERGVVEAEHGDGSFTVRWHFPVQETSRVDASALRALHRWPGGHMLHPQPARMANQYLLLRAIQSKDAGVVGELLRNGSDAGAADDAGNPVLVLAVAARCPPEMLSALLRAGADPDAAGPKGSPLALAVANKDAEAVRVLVERGADTSGVDVSAGGGCPSEVAEIIARHGVAAMSATARAALQQALPGRLLRGVVAASEAAGDSVTLLSYLADKIPAVELAGLLDGAAEATDAAGGTLADALLGVMVRAVEGATARTAESLDAVFCLLRLLAALAEKAPALAPRLRRAGLVRWAERMSDGAQLQADVQAGFLAAKRVKAKHVAKAAAEFVAAAARLTAPAGEEMCLDPRLPRACELLRARDPAGFAVLSEAVAAPVGGRLAPYDLSVCGLASALSAALSSPHAAEARRQWAAFEAAFCQEGSEGPASLRHAPSGAAPARLAQLVRPLIELAGGEGTWPLASTGCTDLADLTRPIKVELLPHACPAEYAAAATRAPRAPFAAPSAACALGGSAGLGAPLTLHVEPLLTLGALENHLLRTMHPGAPYRAFCHHLVGATLAEASRGAPAPLRAARVLGFRMEPAEDEDQDEDGAAGGGEGGLVSGAMGTPAGGAPPLGLDPASRAACLTVAEEQGGEEMVVTCAARGSPAGTVQATRDFSPAADGALAYFEVLVRKRGPSGAIGVGVARAGYPNSKMPGWEPVSHAWHGDDGCTFHSCGNGTPLSAPWAEGDVIGCGVDFRARAVFFTRNGNLQGCPIRGADVAGLRATLGFQTKGECVSLRFRPPFLYDLAAHSLATRQVPVHRLRYLDSEEEAEVVLLARRFAILDEPAFAPAPAALRLQLCRMLAATPRRTAAAALGAALAWARGGAGHGLPDEVGAALAACEGGAEAGTAMAELASGGADGADALAAVLASLGLLSAADGAGDTEMRTESASGRAAARDQSVVIVMPEGFPAELFFQEVEDALRQALSQADATLAPASGFLGDPYRWPDRGFEHEEAWYESLMAALAEQQRGTVARGQTRQEAELLALRLSALVQCELVTDASEDYTARAREARRSHSAGQAIKIGARVQASRGDGVWINGTKMGGDARRGGAAVVTDAGEWLAGLSAHHIRALRGPGRGGGGRGRGGASEMRELQLMLQAHRGGFGERLLGQLLVPGAPAPPDLRRTLSAFEIGDANRDGFSAPKRRLEVWDADAALEAPAGAGAEGTAEEERSLEVVFSVAPRGGEMVKVKELVQLQAAIAQTHAGAALVLAVDAPARPAAGHSWPRHIHSASTLVKDLAARFGQLACLRVLSGLTPDALPLLALTPSSFVPTIVLFSGGAEVARWRQLQPRETLWERSDAPAAGAGAGGSIVVHRSEIATQLAHFLAVQPDAPPAAPLDAAQPMYQCAAVGAGEGRPSALALRYSVRVRADSRAAQLFGGAEGPAVRGDAAEGAGAGDGAGGAARAGGEEEECEIPGQSSCLAPEVRAALNVVRLLHTRLGTRGADAGLWESKLLTRRLLCQLRDVLCAASCSLPAWCLAVPRRFSFLFSFEARKRLLDASGFGTSHALYRIQEGKIAFLRAKHAHALRAAQARLARAREQQDVEAIARVSDEVDDIERLVHAKRIGSIATDLARVSRAAVLRDAMRLLDAHHGSRHLIEVQFHGEDGFGTGVTQNFYEAVSEALQRRAANEETRLWLSDGRDAEARADPEGPFKHLMPPEGLFPRALAPDAPAVEVAEVERHFRFLGRLLAKACRDSYTVSLPLHPLLFALLQRAPDASPGRLLRAFGRAREDLPPDEDWGPHDLARALAAILDAALDAAGCDPAAGPSDPNWPHAVALMADAELMAAHLNRQAFTCSLGAYLAQSDAAFLDPLSGAPLCPGGADRPLTPEGVPEFLSLVGDRWFGAGVARQVPCPL